jgi:uncharacterized protein (TIGR02231 family)
VLSVILVAAIASSAMPVSGRSAGKPKEVELKTEVISATVYKGQAQVRRSGSVALKQGEVRILCDDLPHNFDTASLQVEGAGSADAGIIGTNIIRLKTDPAETERNKELIGKLKILEARRDSLAIQINALNSRLKFVDELGRLPMQQTQAEEFPADIFRVDDWKALMDFLQSERAGADVKIYKLNGRKKQVEEDIEWILSELGAMQRAARRGNRVVIDCAVESAGELTLELAYIVRGSDWIPEYRLNFDPEESEVSLVYNARLSQNTGEDWSDIDVTLSTAMPHAGAAPPELQPHYLSRRIPRPRQPMDASKVEEDRLVGKAIVESPEGELHVRGGRADHVEAQVATSEFAASFRVPAKVDLESGADPKRVRITGGKMPAEISLYAAPRLRNDVFVKGVVTNSLGAPILGGLSEVYVDTEAPGGGRASTFVGRQRIETFAEGQQFPLHLGVDQNVKVEHELEKREYVEKEGKKRKKIRYHYLITLESFKKDAVEVILQDRIPVSTMKEIKIENVDISLKPDERRDDGIVTWKLEPAPGGKTEIRLAYTITFPGDWPEHYLNLE